MHACYPAHFYLKASVFHSLYTVSALYEVTANANRPSYCCCFTLEAFITAKHEVAFIVRQPLEVKFICQLGSS